MTKSLRLNFDGGAGKRLRVPVRRSQKEFHLLNRFKYSGDCRAFNSKGLEDERCHGVRNPIVTVRRIHGHDGSRSAHLAGNIVKQRFRQTPIVGSAILLAENFLRDKFISSRVVQHPNAVYLFVHRVEVCLH